MITFDDPSIFGRSDKNQDIDHVSVENPRERIMISEEELRKMFVAMKNDLNRLEQEMMAAQKKGDTDAIEVAKKSMRDVLGSWENFIKIMDEDIVEMKGVIGRMRETYLGE